jgi:5-methylcytosine-specific restriction endonuclease McrA
MKKLKTIASLRKKADRLLQELGRLTYTQCLACRKPMSCLHHYYPKSMSSALRYNMNNCIPICAGCHIRHHSGDPSIHNIINTKMGEDWLKSLKKDKDKIIKTNREYYNGIIAMLQRLTESTFQK